MSDKKELELRTMANATGGMRDPVGERWLNIVNREKEQREDFLRRRAEMQDTAARRMQESENASGKPWLPSVKPWTFSDFPQRSIPDGIFHPLK